MRYLVIVAVLVVLGGGVLLFATRGDDAADRTAGATLTETGRGGGAQVALTPENADGRGLPAAPQVSDDAITGGRRSAAADRETGQDATAAPADTPVVMAILEDDEGIERRPLAVPPEEDTIERRPLAPRTVPEAASQTAPQATPKTVETERREPQVTGEGAQAPAETVTEAPAKAVAVAPVKAVTEAPAKAVTEAPAGTVTEESAKAVTEAPTATEAEAPAKVVAEAPAKVVAEAPAKVVAEASAETVTEAPAKTVTEAPAKAVAEAPAKAVAEAPAKTVAGAPTQIVAVERQAPVAGGGSRNVSVPVIESRRLGAPSRTVTDRMVPGVRGIEARTGRKVGTPVLAARSAAGRAMVEETRPAVGAAPRGGEGVGPTFDVVRISAAGNAVIAGRAEPGSNVVVLDRGTALGQVKANHRGEWVLVPLKPLPPGATELYIEASLPGVSPRQSEDVVILSVPQRNVSRGGQVGALAVLTPRQGGATRVLQAPSRPVARDKGGSGVSLDVVDYDDAGNIVLSGRADPNAEIRIYSDDRLIGTARSGKAGDWQLKPETRITAGDHELRVDRVSADGKVVARVVLPFSRADLQSIDLRDRRVVVQPGNSLWRIARATYGAGFQFTLIYDANREQIADPDLIFPGQVFKVPKTN